MPIRFAMTERFGKLRQSNFSDSVDWRAIFPLPSLQQYSGGPETALQLSSNPAPGFPNGNWIKFDDAAGIDEAKEELQEVVLPQTTGTLHRDRSAHPQRRLLIGHLALVNSQSDRWRREYHFSISGSEFVEMFVEWALPVRAGLVCKSAATPLDLH